MDILPTLATLLGIKLPPVALDGFDMAPILFENKTVSRLYTLLSRMPCTLLHQSNRNYYIYYPDNVSPSEGIYAVRLNQYKAHYYSHG